MELNISDIPPTICLNMIVKNESHIIKNTLEKLCNKIHFSYWVICDTGSTDNTQQIITDFFNDKNIPGELHNNEWKNFAYNRNIALNEAFNKTDLLLVFDADDEIHGNITMPKIVNSDGYLLNFGNSHGISYERILLVNNKIRWEFKSVIHEYINCLKPNPQISHLEGNYYVESGRTGSRNIDPEKYLKDANILEEAYYEAKTNNDNIYMRYGFYCANSYKDAGKTEEAIKWYKITLGNENWSQEKYMCCLNLYNLYNIIGEKEKGLYYLVESFNYDLERMECVSLLIKEYCSRGFNKIAYNYYCMIKDFYEYKYLQTNNTHKLFIENDKPNFFLPYYIIIVADKVKETFSEAKQTIIKMYEIIFTKKYPITDDFYIGNLLYNLQFFIHFCCKTDNFINLANEYLDFLHKNGVNLEKWDFLLKPEYINTGINVDNYFIKEVTDKTQKFSTEICKNTKNILIYTGFLDFKWNYTYMQDNALGGSEKAVAYLTKCFPKDYNIYISGEVENEIIDNIQYIHLDELTKLINLIPFHTVIVSRYIGFYEMFKECSYYQTYIWAHDILLLPYGSNLNESQILKKWNKYINKCICLTEWHKNEFIEKYPILKDKITLINNGLDCQSFSTDTNKKIKNKFIYSSRPDRGLNILLELWPQILENLPDATLVISFYGTFPSDQLLIKTIIDSYDSIQYLGKLKFEQLYQEMASSEYWLYPTHWPETSCITALEMLMSGVICLYYPVAGLINTLGNYGIPVEKGQEIEAINNLTVKRKTEIIKRGKEYALSCSWTNRAKEWEKVLGLNKKKWYFYCSLNFEIKMIQQYIDNLNNIYPDYCIYLTNNKNNIITENPSKLTFVYEVFDITIFEYLPNTEFSFLNTEPLNIPCRLQNIQKINYDLGYYDYSESNLHILNENGIDFKYKKILPYICSSLELLQLQKINTNTEKVFDFGIIKTLGGEITYRRQHIVDFLKSNNFSINIIEGWSDDRDIELAKCKILLNIHGNLYNNISMIFEHIRCNRLLESGFNILSETCYNLSVDFIDKYPNLKIIDYEDFFNIDKIIHCYNNTLSNNEYNQYVLNILNSAHSNMHWFPQQHITFLENIFLEFNPDNMVIYDIGSSVLHWTQNAQNIWKNSKIYLFDGMTEMKLFYDEYNNKNNTTYDYNIGILCDEDYKRICFYQNDEFSGGNSYYKEIGHIDSHKIFTEKNIKQKIGMKLETIVKMKNIPAPDLIKIDVQGAELDILKGSMKIINNSKFLIVELQHIEYNKGAPLCNETCNFLIENGWEVYAEKFSNNGPDADWCFINTKYNYNKLPNNTFNKIRDYRYNICNKGQTTGLSLNKYVTNCIDNIGVNNILNICDIGCGIGEQSKLLLSQYPNFKFTGIDWSHITIDYLHKNTSFFNEIVHCKSSNLPFNDKQFSLALCMENMEHLYINDCINAFKELKRISEYIILTVPRPEYIVNYSWLNSEINEAINDNTPLTLSDFISLESCVHKTGYYESSLICAGFKKCDIEHPYNGIYYCKSNNLDIYKIQYKGIDNNDLLKTDNYKDKYIDLLHKSLNLKFIQNQPKIIDCFIFYNELDMLNYRLNILANVVDYFVLVESTHTHVGKEKTLFYNENKHLFEKFNHKIIHIIVDDFPHKYPNININKEEQWVNEKFQRNCISRGIDKLNLNNEDIITIMDVDEIPNPKILTQIKMNNNLSINILEMDFYYYNLNSKMDHKWYHSKILTFKKYIELNITCDNIRFFNCPIIHNGGWHLSYFGNEKFIKNKLENFTHQEFNKIEFTDEEHIKTRIKNGQDLFDRSNKICYININDNTNLPPEYDNYLTHFYHHSVEKGNTNSNDKKFKIGFYDNGLSERGTTTALYSYADYAEKYFNCESIIFYNKYFFSNDIQVIQKFNNRFKVYSSENFDEIDKIILEKKIKYFYNICSGKPIDTILVKNSINLIHAVFNIEPFGDIYAGVSDYLIKKGNYKYLESVPHMVDLPQHNDDLRRELNIPMNYFVIGRYGGFEQFDIEIAHQAIIEILKNNNNLFFIFVNTRNFYNHPRIMYLNKIIDPHLKVKFINTCDCMIHARSDGETFGLAIAEFSTLNKPIITSKSYIDNCHIDILGDNAIIYNSKESLLNILNNIETITNSKTDWNMYKEYTPLKVMKKFHKVFLNKEDFLLNINHQ